MAFPLIGWWRRRKQPDTTTFTRATTGELDIVMAPPYVLSESEMDGAHGRVDEMIERLKPDALDAGSREVLNNLINAWTDQSLARLKADRDERQAVGDILVGLAEEEVTRRKPRYDADLAKALHMRNALDITFSELATQKTGELRDAWPQRLDHGHLEPTLGPLGPASTVPPSTVDDEGDRDGSSAVSDEDDRTDEADPPEFRPYTIPPPPLIKPPQTRNGDHDPGKPAYREEPQ
ncbi:hypothetical protein [Amycolatopsis sp. NBC_00438]|uniref:hypothetical protein n=1 Tax=Amycolatopsis sp. NBC_00438 TaxID=2903558 RepID=UPI002E1FB860